MTESEAKEFKEFLSKLVDSNDGNSVMRIINETYGEAHRAILLTRLAAVSQALTNGGMFDFCTKYRNAPLLAPTCFGCGTPVYNGKVHEDLPTVALCNCCTGYIGLGQKIEKDKPRLLDSLTLVLQESKTLCEEPEEGCIRCQSNTDVEHLIASLKSIRK